MARQSIFYLILTLLAIGLIACGDSDDEEDVQSGQVTPSTTQTQPPDDDSEVVAGEEIDFEVEEATIQEVMAKHAEAVGPKDIDEMMTYWLKSDSKDVFTSWVFWAGTFEKNEGWTAIKNGWDGIFRLLGGDMTVDITSVAIDSRAKNASLRASYRWGNTNGDLIALMKKDEDEWKIMAIDYTDGRFGKQVKELTNPAYKNPA